MSNWETKKLGEITSWFSGGTPKKDEPAYWNGDIPWISANSMDGTRYHTSDLKITAEGLKNGSRLAPQDALLLLVRGGALHTKIPIGIARKPLAFNQDVKAIVAKPEFIDPWFLLAWFMSKKDYLLNNVVEYTGIGAGKLDTVRLQNLEINLPPIKEQKSLAHIANCLEEKIILNQQMNETLEGIAQALFKSWFVDFDPVKAKAEGRKPEGMDDDIALLFPNTLEGGIPYGWNKGTMEDLFILQRGFDLPQPQRIPGKYPILAASGPSGTHYKYMMKGPGVTTGRSGVLGNVFFIHEDFWPLNTSLFIKEYKNVTPSFAYFFLQQIDISAFNAGSAVPTLNRNHIHSLSAVIPKNEVIQQFDKLVMPLFKRQRQNQIQINTLSELRDILLPHLISGKLRIDEISETVEALAL